MQKVAQIFNELRLFGLTRQGATLKYRFIPSHAVCLAREPLAQLVERFTFNEDVQGSNP